jgi:hypothetical protein
VGLRPRELNGRGSDSIERASAETSAASSGARPQLAELLDQLLDGLHELENCLGGVAKPEQPELRDQAALRARMQESIFPQRRRLWRSQIAIPVRLPFRRQLVRRVLRRGAALVLYAALAFAVAWLTARVIDS